MNITRIRIYPFDTGTRGGRIRGIADVELDGVLLIKGIRILESRSGGLFLGMPSVRTRSGEYRDTVILEDTEFARMFRDRVIEAFRNTGSDESADGQSHPKDGGTTTHEQ